MKYYFVCSLFLLAGSVGEVLATTLNEHLAIEQNDLLDPQQEECPEATPHRYNNQCNKCPEGRHYYGNACNRCPENRPHYYNDQCHRCPEGRHYYGNACNRCPENRPHYYDNACHIRAQNTQANAGTPNSHLPQSLRDQLGATKTPEGGYLPYRIIGVNCLEGESCTSQPAPYAGFQTKSNIPLDDERQSRIRPNVISKAVLERKVQACKENIASPLSNPEEQCRPTTANITEIGSRRIILYNLRDITCNREDVSCQKITTGPYAGLVERTNDSTDWSGLSESVQSQHRIALTNAPSAEEQCIRNGANVNCGKNTPPVPDHEVFVRIGIRCGSTAIYCETIQLKVGNTTKKFIKKSNILPSDPRYAQTVAIVTPHTRKCYRDIFAVPKPGNISTRSPTVSGDSNSGSVK